MARTGERHTSTSPRSANGPRPRNRSAARDGAVAGLLLTSTLVAVSFLGWTLAGLPFAPFDLFDWLVRLLPGRVVTAAIDTSVGLARMFGVTNISVAAKAGDQMLAIGMLVAAGIGVGAVMFSALSWSDEPARAFGGVLGTMFAGVAYIAERRLARLPPGFGAAALWVFATFVAWGVALGWVHDALKLATTEDAKDTEGKRVRRRFLFRLGGVAALAAVGATLVGNFVRRSALVVTGRRWSDDHSLPNDASNVMPVPGTRAEFTRLEDFYRIDTDTRPPAIDGGRWRLAIGGLVNRPQVLMLADLQAMDPIHEFATLCCISNPPGGDLISTTRWTGVSLQDLLPRLELQASATHLKISSADGFFETVSLDAVRANKRVMLAYAWDGLPLPVEHGYPLRLYVPNVYGMKQPKWIAGIDALNHWEPGYWVQRGWSRDGSIATMSTVDAVVHHAEVTQVGGVAFAGSRGVSKVEVRVDGGDWHAAELRQPISSLTWAIWRAELRLAPGTHQFTVRAFDLAGEPQAASFHVSSRA